MAVQKGNLSFIGYSGRKYAKALYLDDTATNPVRFGNPSAGANTPDYWTPPEPGAINDISIAAATGQTQTQINVNDIPTGDMLLNANHLVTVENRPKLNLPLLPGQKLTLIQVA